jgi:hypothetical protein
MYRINRYGLIFATAFVFVMVSNLQAADESVPLLRYGFAAGKEYAFQVNIQVEAENHDETHEGVLSYTVASAKDKEFVLRQSGSLGNRIKAHDNATVMSPIPIGLMMGRMGMPVAGVQQGITINRQGERINSRQLTPLPFLLGDTETLVIEEFPAQAQSNWEKHRDVEIVERASSAPFGRLGGIGMRGATSDGKHTAAKEQINYTVIKSDGGSVDISKKYSLLASPESDQPARFEMTGEGQFTFDQAEKLIKTLSMKYECRLNEKNVTRKYPITLTYSLLSKEELAERKKKAEEARAAAIKAAEPKEFEPGERDKLLKDLKSADNRRIIDAANRLAKTPVDDHPADISKALVLLLGHSDTRVRNSAAAALKVWASPEAESALIKASQMEDASVRNPAIEALGNIKTPQAAKAAAEQMYRSRGEASKALKAMGPVAENATIECLKDRDMWVRGEACNVLKEIGGKKSIKALHDLSAKLGRDAPGEIPGAVSAITLRLASQPAAADETDTSKPKSDKSKASAKDKSATAMRTWHDSTGSFSVEAVLLSQKEGKVVLQKKDGKTITVDVSKLSPADKKFVANHAADLPGDSENPFD